MHQLNWRWTIWGKQSLRKTISEQSEALAILNFVGKPCKMHQDFTKLVWSEKSSCAHYGAVNSLDRCGTQTKTSVSQTNVVKKGELTQNRPILPGNDAFKLIVSKTRGFRRSLSDTFKLRTIVKVNREGESKTTEEVIDDEHSSVDILRPDEYIYRTTAPNTRRKAICDAIEKRIVQNGGMLRSLRRDLVVAINLTNWKLL